MGSRLPPMSENLLLQDVQRLFDRYDLDKDNLLRIEDISRFYEDLAIRIDLDRVRQEFEHADLNRDGKIDREEFACYVHGYLRFTFGLQNRLASIFAAYSGFGAGTNAASSVMPFMESRSFVHLLRDCEVINNKLTTGSVDIIFNKVKTKGERKISFEQFVQGLLLVAHDRAEPLENMLLRVMQLEGPSVKGTVPDAVRFYDDRVGAMGGVNNNNNNGAGGGWAVPTAASLRAAHDFYASNPERPSSASSGRSGGGGGGSLSSAPAPSNHPSAHRGNNHDEYFPQLGVLREALGASESAMSEEGSAMEAIRRRNDDAESSEGGAGSRVNRVFFEDASYIASLYAIFTRYNTTMTSNQDPHQMECASWVRIFVDKRLLSTRLSVATLESIFEQVKDVGRPKLTFRQFLDALHFVAERFFGDFDSLALILIGVPSGGGGGGTPTNSNGGVVHGSGGGGSVERKASSKRHPSNDKVRNNESDSPASHSQQQPQRSNSNARRRTGGEVEDTAPPPPSRPEPPRPLRPASSKRRVPSANRERAPPPPAPVAIESFDESLAILKPTREYKFLHALFRAYNSFGGGNNLDTESMEGRTFVKLLREKGILNLQVRSTDADVVFISVKTMGTKRISFGQFVKALHELYCKDAARYHGSFWELVAFITSQGGPEIRATVADQVPLHDDRRNYTGVYSRGGPNTSDKRAVDFKYMIDRNTKTDVRGVPTHPLVGKE